MCKLPVVTLKNTPENKKWIQALEPDWESVFFIKIPEGETYETIDEKAKKILAK